MRFNLSSDPEPNNSAGNQDPFSIVGSLIAYFPWAADRFHGNDTLQVGVVNKGPFHLTIPEIGSKRLFEGDWFAFSDFERLTKLERGHQTEILLLAVPVSLIASLAEERIKLPAKLHCLLCPPRNFSFFCSGRASAGVRICLGKLLSENSASVGGSMLRQARCLELLARILEQPEFDNGKACGGGCVPHDDQSIREIAQHLEESLSEPHSLAVLSRKFHINEFSLKKRFKETFGTTVFAYLRRARMEKAAELLVDQQRGVLEVALEVGYSNPGHFARAFREQFGVLPKAFQKRKQQRFPDTPSRAIFSPPVSGTKQGKSL